MVYGMGAVQGCARVEGRQGLKNTFPMDGSHGRSAGIREALGW